LDVLGHCAACVDRHLYHYDEGTSMAESALEDVHSEAKSSSHPKQIYALDETTAFLWKTKLGDIEMH
jgi:hypothetical protein